MIGYIKGYLIAQDEPQVLIDVGGVGYEVYLGRLAHRFDLGQQVELWIHTHVREDQLMLFGFSSSEHKRLYLKLTTVSGVGPKLAFAAITELEPETIVQAILGAQVHVLKSVPGIGKRVAERMILELKDKLVGFGLMHNADNTRSAADQSWRDLVDALNGLGFADRNIRNVIGLIRQEHDTSEMKLDRLLKIALQKINQ